MPKQPLTVEMPDGTTRYLRERVESLNSDRFTGDLQDAAIYFAELAGRLSQYRVLVVDDTGDKHDLYNYAVLTLEYTSPETDEEYNNRLEMEALVQRNKDKAEQDARNKAIARRTRKMKGRPLSEQEERALLADLEKKYSNG